MGVLGHIVYESLAEAMEFYEDAMRVQPVGNDDAALRWNSCARVLMQNPALEPEATTQEPYEPYLE